LRRTDDEGVILRKPNEVRRTKDLKMRTMIVREILRFAQDDKCFTIMGDGK